MGKLCNLQKSDSSLSSHSNSPALEIHPTSTPELPPQDGSNGSSRLVDADNGSGKFGEMLLKQGLITQQQLVEALSIQERVNARLGRILVKMGYLENKALAECLSKQLEFPVTNFDKLEIPARVIKQIPYELAKKHLAIPISYVDDTLIVAMADPANSRVIEDLQFKSNLTIKPMLATETSIIDAFRKYYQIDDLEYSSLTEEELLLEEEVKIDEIDDYGKLLSDAVEKFGIEFDDAELKREEIYSANGTPIVKLVHSIITKAIKVGASDIHLEPFDKMYYVRYRLDGELHKTMSLPPAIKEAVTSRIKILANIDIAERRLPQDGRIKIWLGKTKAIDIRVNTLPTIFGECVVLRVLDKSNLNVDLTNLGFTNEGLKKFDANIIKPSGMILVTGPTGSGKTTTLYSALNKLNTSNKKIHTAEDPIEYNFTGIHQTQVKEEVGLTFAQCLRAFLRQDPDIIMVGEIRDRETAEIAVKSALTGHLVLSTLHTNDCSSTVGRLLDIGIKPYMISSALSVVVAQRLLRRICEHCKTPVTDHKPDLLREAGVDPDEFDDVELYQGKGCKECSGTGFKGRTAVFEIIGLDDDLKEIIISSNFSEVLLRQIAREKGVLSLRQEGLRKVREGITTIEEVFQKTMV